MNIYQAQLMDYYQHPRNRGTLPNPDFVSEQYNPSCGDSIVMQGLVQHGRITQLMFDGRGCVISQAIASMITEQCRDKTLDEIVALDQEFVQQFVGRSLGPTRLKCALLPLQVLQEAIKFYQQRDHSHAQ